MDREELVRLVTQEVARRLAATGGEAGSPPATTGGGSGLPLATTGGGSGLPLATTSGAAGPWLAAAPRRLALIEPGTDLRLALSGLLRLPETAVVLTGAAAAAPETPALGQLLPTLPDDPAQLARLVPEVESLYVLGLRPATAARLALGLDGGTVPDLVQAALWAGRPVVLCPDWSADFTGAPPAVLPVDPPGAPLPGPYRQLFLDYLERLRALGATVRPLAALAAPDPDPAAPDPASPAPDPASPAPDPAAPLTAVPYPGRLLTAADVLALAGGPVRQLLLSRGTLVTALAADTAREKGIQLTRR